MRLPFASTTADRLPEVSYSYVIDPVPCVISVKFPRASYAYVSVSSAPY